MFCNLFEVVNDLIVCGILGFNFIFEEGFVFLGLLIELFLNCVVVIEVKIN